MEKKITKIRQDDNVGRKKALFLRIFFCKTIGELPENRIVLKFCFFNSSELVGICVRICESNTWDKINRCTSQSRYIFQRIEKTEHSKNLRWWNETWSNLNKREFHGLLRLRRTWPTRKRWTSSSVSGNGTSACLTKLAFPRLSVFEFEIDRDRNSETANFQ